MLLTEELLLLLTDDATGRHVVDGGTLDLGLAGAVLLELAAAGAVDVAGPGEQVRAGRLVVRSQQPTGDAVLDESLRRLSAAGPRKPKDVLPKVAKGLREEPLVRLTDRGILARQDGRVLGIFATRSWPAADGRHESVVRSGLTDVLVGGRVPSPIEAALISLLSAVDAVTKVVAGAPARELKRRAKAIAEGEFAAEAVRKAVQAVNAAVAGAVTASVIASTSASGS